MGESGHRYEEGGNSLPPADYPEIHGLVSAGGESDFAKYFRLHLTSLFLFNEFPLRAISNQVYSGI